MFRFSTRQYFLLAVGLALILLAVSLDRVAAVWDRVVSDEPITWHRLTITTDANAYVSALDESTLVVRSATNSEARLTLFTREDDGLGPSELVKHLCDRDSCVYVPLENSQLNGAIADYVSDAPLRIVLMHPVDSWFWLEYKGPPQDFETFALFINTIVAQIHEQQTAGNTN